MCNSQQRWPSSNPIWSVPIRRLTLLRRTLELTISLSLTCRDAVYKLCWRRICWRKRPYFECGVECRDGKAVLDFCQNKLDIPIATQDISIAHRLKKSTNSTEAPPVIVKFSTRKVRDAVFAARRRLKGSSLPIFINEDLTKRSADLYRCARALFMNKTITKTWTNIGFVFIKTLDNPNIKRLKISDVHQLNAL